MDSLALLPLLFLIFLLSATIKGTVGLGLPASAIGFMSFVVDPRTAIALILIPMLLSNAWQLYRSGDVLGALRRYRLFCVCLFVGVGLTTLGTAGVSDRVLLGWTGVVILIFVAANTVLTLPALPERWDRSAQVGFGATSGIIGGLTSVWAPPMAMYLVSKRVPKDEFVRATGLMIFVGSIPLLIGYAGIGFFPMDLALVSAAMLVPTYLGFTLGEWLRSRLTAERFLQVLMFVFFCIGLNLIRRAVFG